MVLSDGRYYKKHSPDDDAVAAANEKITTLQNKFDEPVLLLALCDSLARIITSPDTTKADRKLILAEFRKALKEWDCIWAPLRKDV